MWIVSTADSVLSNLLMLFHVLIRWLPLHERPILDSLCKFHDVRDFLFFMSKFSTPLGLVPSSALSPIKKIRDELFYYFNAAKRLNFSNLSSSERYFVVIFLIF